MEVAECLLPRVSNVKCDWIIEMKNINDPVAQAVLSFREIDQLFTQSLRDESDVILVTVAKITDYLEVVGDIRQDLITRKDLSTRNKFEALDRLKALDDRVTKVLAQTTQRLKTLSEVTYGK